MTTSDKISERTSLIYDCTGHLRKHFKKQHEHVDFGIDIIKKKYFTDYTKLYFEIVETYKEANKYPLYHKYDYEKIFAIKFYALIATRLNLFELYTRNHKFPVTTPNGKEEMDNGKVTLFELTYLVPFLATIKLQTNMYTRNIPSNYIENMLNLANETPFIDLKNKQTEQYIKKDIIDNLIKYSTGYFASGQHLTNHSAQPSDKDKSREYKLRCI